MTATVVQNTYICLGEPGPLCPPEGPRERAAVAATAAGGRGVAQGPGLGAAAAGGSGGALPAHAHRPQRPDEGHRRVRPTFSKYMTAQIPDP